MPIAFNWALYLGQETRGTTQVWLYNDAGSIRAIGYGTTAPTAGTWAIGDFIFDSASGSTIGYRCTTGGTPGTWTTLLAGGSGSAPDSASYVTLGLNGTLTSERVLTAGSGISITDGGANGNVTVSSATLTVAQLIPNIPANWTASGVSSALTTVRDECHATLLFRADRAYSSVTLRIRVTTAQTYTTGNHYAYWGIGIGNHSAIGATTISITPIVTADAEAAGDFASVALVTRTFTTTGLIAAGDEVWALMSSNGLAQGAMRCGLPDELQIGCKYLYTEAGSGATILNTGVGSPATFNIAGVVVGADQRVWYGWSAS